MCTSFSYTGITFDSTMSKIYKQCISLWRFCTIIMIIILSDNVFYGFTSLFSVMHSWIANYLILKLQNLQNHGAVIWAHLKIVMIFSLHGPPIRYVKLRVAHAPGMPGRFSPPPTSEETAGQRSKRVSGHVCQARARMHAGIANPRWPWKRSRHSRRLCNP